MSQDSPSSSVDKQTGRLPVQGLDAADLDKVQKDLLWAYYADVRAQVRHVESLRASGAQFVLVVASALIAVINDGGGIQSSDLPLAITVIALGVFFTLFSTSYVERAGRNAHRADYIRYELDRLFFTGSSAKGLGDLETEADGKPFRSARMKVVKVMSTDPAVFWVLLPLFVCLMGMWLAWTAATA